jgi:hypothetical protein
MPEFQEPHEGTQAAGRSGRSQGGEESQPPVSTSTSHRIALPLDEFGQRSLAAQASALDVPRAAIVKQAALYFLAEPRSERLARRVPFFARERGGAELKLMLDFDKADWAALEEEADAQQVSLERLLVHATLLLLADLDSGRVAIRILEGEE